MLNKATFNSQVLYFFINPMTLPRQYTLRYINIYIGLCRPLWILLFLFVEELVFMDSWHNKVVLQAL